MTQRPQRISLVGTFGYSRRTLGRREHCAPGGHSRVLAPFAVDQAACLRADGEQRVDSSASSDSVGWTVTDTCTTATKDTSRETARREDVAQRQALAHQTGLHRRRPGLAPEPQRPVRPNEIVVAPQELDVPAELVCATSVAWRAPAQVRRPLTNREVEALDERRVGGEFVGIRHRSIFGSREPGVPREVVAMA